MTRGYGEWNQRAAEFMANGKVPCPDCGELLPADDDAARMAHYQQHAEQPAFTVDPEFQALIPPLSGDEYQALEASLKSEGCRDALVVWQEGGVLLDGHNRYEICRVNGLPYHVKQHSFTSREDAMLWMIENQLSRRNIVGFVRAELMVKAKPVVDALRAQAKANMSAGGKGLANLPNLHTREELAKLAGVGDRTIGYVQTVIKEAPDEILTKARSGEISTHRAYRMTQALNATPDEVRYVALKHAGDEPDKVTILYNLFKTRDAEGSNATFDEISASGGFHYGEELELWCNFADSGVLAIKDALKELAKYHARIAAELRRADQIAGINAQEVSLEEITERFAVIYADPPWEYEFSQSDSRAIENQYPTMSLDDICALPVAGICTDSAVLFLWATSPKLAEAMAVITAWGFEYKTCMVWDKERMGMGYYARQQHELLLIATRGNMPTPEPAVRPASVIRIERSETHSQKPAKFRKLIETMYPEFQRIELFAREVPDNWCAWGNQIHDTAQL